MNGEIASCTIATVAIESMLAHARSAAPHEACGLLLAHGGTIIDALATRNVAAHPQRSFEIDPAALLRTHREARGRGETVAGHYHSHPNNVLMPSATDAARASEDGQLWLIVDAARVTAWRAMRGGTLHDRFVPVELVVV